MKMPIKFPIPKPWAIFPKSGKKNLDKEGKLSNIVLMLAQLYAPNIINIKSSLIFESVNKLD